MNLSNEPINMLIRDLYVVESIVNNDNDKIEALIKLNKDHEIFKGHFPDNPIMPGVCSMQVIKELTEHLLNKKLQLVTSSNVKFMTLINPFVDHHLKFELEIIETEDLIKVKNTTYFQDVVALKLVNTYKQK